ncbi:PAS domain S-box protein, partial [bacterium]|nr:PAS domain S-box protein [bacterium]
MKVRAKLGLGFLVVVLLIWVTVFFAGNTYSNIDEEFQLLREDIVPDVIAMSEMEMAANKAAHEVMDYVINGDEESKQITLSATEYLEKLGLEHLEHETHIGQEEQKVAEELMVKIDTFTGTVVELISLKEQGVSTDELLRREDEATHPALATLLEQVREHKAVHMEELAEAEEAVHEAQTTGVQLLFLIAGLTTLFAAGVAFFVVRSIVNPLRALHKGTEVIGQGNLDYKVGTNARDEIGQLSRAFDQMTEDLAKTTTSIDNLNKEITERKRAEEEVTAGRKILEDILETMIDGVTITDMQGRITHINKAATLQLGYTKEESIGKTPGEIFVDEQDVPKFVEYVKAAASGKQMAAEEYLCKRKDGTRFVASTNLSVLKDSKGNPYQIIAVHRDITVRKRAEEALRESEEKFRTFVDTASDLM